MIHPPSHLAFLGLILALSPACLDGGKKPAAPGAQSEGEGEGAGGEEGRDAREGEGEGDNGQGEEGEGAGEEGVSQKAAA